MRTQLTDRLATLIDNMRRRMATPAHAAAARAAEDSGEAVQALLGDGDDGLKRALQLAIGSKTSLICEHNGYQIVVVNPDKALIGTVGAGGVVVTDGANSVIFDPTSGTIETDGETHRRGTFYWDLGDRNARDGVFIIPLED